MSLNLAHYLQLSAETHPDKTAVILDGQKLTYAQLNDMVRRVATILQERGVKRGDKVAMMLPNCPQFPVVYYGILYAGATVVPINVLLKAHEILYHIDDADVKVLFTWKGFYSEAVHAYRDSSTCGTLIVISSPGDSEEMPDSVSFQTLLQAADPPVDMIDTMPDDTAVIL